VPSDTNCSTIMYGCTIDLVSRFGMSRKPVQTTTATPGKAVKPPTTPPINPTVTPLPTPPDPFIFKLEGFSSEYTEYAARITPIPASVWPPAGDSRPKFQKERRESLPARKVRNHLATPLSMSSAYLHATGLSTGIG